MYGYEGIAVGIDRLRLSQWIRITIEREQRTLFAREAELKRLVGDPAVAMQMIEALAAGHAVTYAASTGELRSDEQKQISSLASRVRQLRERIAMLSKYEVGLRHANDSEITVPLSVVADLDPDGIGTIGGE